MHFRSFLLKRLSAAVKASATAISMINLNFNALILSGHSSELLLVLHVAVIEAQEREIERGSRRVGKEILDKGRFGFSDDVFLFFSDINPN